MENLLKRLNEDQKLKREFLSLIANPFYNEFIGNQMACNYHIEMRTVDLLTNKAALRAFENIIDFINENEENKIEP